MTDRGSAAMVSTQSVPWESIPQAKLMEAISSKAAGLFRSDSIEVKGAPAVKDTHPLAPGFVKGKFWADYFPAGEGRRGNFYCSLTETIRESVWNFLKLYMVSSTSPA